MEELTQSFYDNEATPYKQGQEAELMDYLNKYPWQAWMTGTAEPGTSFEALDRAVGAWRGRLAHLASMRVSCMGVCNLHPQPHVHVLLLGTNKRGRTLARLDEDFINEMVLFWKVLMHRSAKYELLNNVAGAVRYVVEDNLINRQRAAILSPRGIKLLQKCIATR